MGDQAQNLGMCPYQVSNRQAFGEWDEAQAIEPYWLWLDHYIFN